VIDRTQEVPKEKDKKGGTKLYSFGFLALPFVFSDILNWIINNPGLGVLSILGGIGIAVGLYFAIWRIFFPVSWYSWRLKSSNWYVRYKAAEALEKLGALTTELKIKKYIKDLDDEDLRSAAAEALVKIGQPAVDSLIKRLEDSDKYVRKKAAEALGKIGDKRAVEPLIKALGDSEWYVRWKAAEALGKIGDKRAVEPLIKALGDSEKLVREVAAEALEKLGALTTELKIKKYIKDLGDSDIDVRGAAARALGKLGALTTELKIKKYIKDLDDSNSNVRDAAAEVLEKLGALTTELKIKKYNKDLEDSGWYVRKAAAEALEKLGALTTELKIKKYIKDLGDSYSWYVREEAAYALGKIGDKRAVEPLTKALSDSSWYVRGAAAEALVKIGKPAVDSLIKALGDSDSRVRSSAAEVLGKIGDERAVEPLIKALGDSESYVRGAAAEALVKIGQPAVEPLIKALGDRDSDVRKAAAYVLGEIGDKRAVEPLIKALGDSDENVCEAAAEALKTLITKKEIAGKKIVKALTGYEEVEIGEAIEKYLSSLVMKNMPLEFSIRTLIPEFLKKFNIKNEVEKRELIKAFELGKELALIDIQPCNCLYWGVPLAKKFSSTEEEFNKNLEILKEAAIKWDNWWDKKGKNLKWKSEDSPYGAQKEYIDVVVSYCFEKKMSVKKSKILFDLVFSNLQIITTPRKEIERPEIVTKKKKYLVRRGFRDVCPDDRYAYTFDGEYYWTNDVSEYDTLKELEDNPWETYEVEDIIETTEKVVLYVPLTYREYDFVDFESTLENVKGSELLQSSLGFTTNEIIDIVKEIIETIKSFSPYLPIELAENLAEEFVKNLLASINRKPKFAKGYEEEEREIKKAAEELLKTDEFKELGISSLEVKIVENDYLPVDEGGKVVGLSFARLDLKDNKLYITEGMLKKLKARAPPEYSYRQLLIEELKEAKEVKKGVLFESFHKSIRNNPIFVIHNEIAKHLLKNKLSTQLLTENKLSIQKDGTLKDLLKDLKDLSSLDYKFVVVGGAIRDYLLEGKTNPEEMDILVKVRLPKEGEIKNKVLEELSNLRLPKEGEIKNKVLELEELSNLKSEKFDIFDILEFVMYKSKKEFFDILKEIVIEEKKFSFLPEDNVAKNFDLLIKEDKYFRDRYCEEFKVKPEEIKGFNEKDEKVSKVDKEKFLLEYLLAKKFDLLIKTDEFFKEKYCVKFKIKSDDEIKGFYEKDEKVSKDDKKKFLIDYLVYLKKREEAEQQFNQAIEKLAEKLGVTKKEILSQNYKYKDSLLEILGAVDEEGNIYTFDDWRKELEIIPDFTINKIGICSDGSVFDPYNGLEDIKNKKLRLISYENIEGSLSFRTIFRMLRFKHQFGFKVDEKLEEEVKNFFDRPLRYRQMREFEEFKKKIKTAKKEEKKPSTMIQVGGYAAKTVSVEKTEKAPKEEKSAKTEIKKVTVPITIQTYTGVITLGQAIQKIAITSVKETKEAKAKPGIVMLGGYGAAATVAAKTAEKEEEKEIEFNDPFKILPLLIDVFYNAKDEKKVLKEIKGFKNIDEIIKTTGVKLEDIVNYVRAVKLLEKNYKISQRRMSYVNLEDINNVVKMLNLFIENNVITVDKLTPLGTKIEEMIKHLFVLPEDVSVEEFILNSQKYSRLPKLQQNEEKVVKERILNQIKKELKSIGKENYYKIVEDYINTLWDLNCLLFEGKFALNFTEDQLLTAARVVASLIVGEYLPLKEKKEKKKDEKEKDEKRKEIEKLKLINQPQDFVKLAIQKQQLSQQDIDNLNKFFQEFSSGRKTVTFVLAGYPPSLYLLALIQHLVGKNPKLKVYIVLRGTKEKVSYVGYNITKQDLEEVLKEDYFKDLKEKISEKQVEVVEGPQAGYIDVTLNSEVKKVIAKSDILVLTEEDLQAGKISKLKFKKLLLLPEDIVKEDDTKQLQNQQHPTQINIDELLNEELPDENVPRKDDAIKKIKEYIKNNQNPIIAISDIDRLTYIHRLYGRHHHTAGIVHSILHKISKGRGIDYYRWGDDEGLFIIPQDKDAQQLLDEIRKELIDILKGKIGVGALTNIKNLTYKEKREIERKIGRKLVRYAGEYTVLYEIKNNNLLESWKGKINNWNSKLPENLKLIGYPKEIFFTPTISIGAISSEIFKEIREKGISNEDVLTLAVTIAERSLLEAKKDRNKVCVKNKSDDEDRNIIENYVKEKQKKISLLEFIKIKLLQLLQVLKIRRKIEVLSMFKFLEEIKDKEGCLVVFYPKYAGMSFKEVAEKQGGISAESLLSGVINEGLKKFGSLVDKVGKLGSNPVYFLINRTPEENRLKKIVGSINVENTNIDVLVIPVKRDTEIYELYYGLQEPIEFRAEEFIKSSSKNRVIIKSPEELIELNSIKQKEAQEEAKKFLLEKEAEIYTPIKEAKEEIQAYLEDNPNYEQSEFVKIPIDFVSNLNKLTAEEIIKILKGVENLTQDIKEKLKSVLEKKLKVKSIYDVAEAYRLWKKGYISDEKLKEVIRSIKFKIEVLEKDEVRQKFKEKFEQKFGQEGYTDEEIDEILALTALVRTKEIKFVLVREIIKGIMQKLNKDKIDDTLKKINEIIASEGGDISQKVKKIEDYLKEQKFTDDEEIELIKPLLTFLAEGREFILKQDVERTINNMYGEKKEKDEILKIINKNVNTWTKRAEEFILDDVLRFSSPQRKIINIVGPAKSGKTTFGKKLVEVLKGERIQAIHFDTGWVYRAYAYKMKDMKDLLDDDKKIKVVEDIIKNTKVEYINGKIYVDGKEVSEENLKSEEVEKIVGKLGRGSEAREVMAKTERKIVEDLTRKFDLVVLTSRGFYPNTLYNIYYTANFDKRVKNRMKELKGLGKQPVEKEVRKDLKARDKADKIDKLERFEYLSDLVIDASQISEDKIEEKIINEKNIIKEIKEKIKAQNNIKLKENKIKLLRKALAENKISFILLKHGQWGAMDEVLRAEILAKLSKYFEIVCGQRRKVKLEEVLKRWGPTGITKKIEDLAEKGIISEVEKEVGLRLVKELNADGFERWLKGIKSSNPNNVDIRELEFLITISLGDVEQIMLIRKTDREKIIEDLDTKGDKREGRITEERVKSLFGVENINEIPEQDFVKTVVIGELNAFSSPENTIRGIVGKAIKEGSLSHVYEQASQLGFAERVGIIANGVHIAATEELVREFELMDDFDVDYFLRYLDKSRKTRGEPEKRKEISIKPTEISIENLNSKYLENFDQKKIEIENYQPQDIIGLIEKKYNELLSKTNNKIQKELLRIRKEALVKSIKNNDPYYQAILQATEILPEIIKEEFKDKQAIHICLARDSANFAVAEILKNMLKNINMRNNILIYYLSRRKMKENYQKMKEIIDTVLTMKSYTDQNEFFNDVLKLFNKKMKEDEAFKKFVEDVKNELEKLHRKTYRKIVSGRKKLIVHDVWADGTITTFLCVLLKSINQNVDVKQFIVVPKRENIPTLTVTSEKANQNEENKLKAMFGWEERDYFGETNIGHPIDYKDDKLVESSPVKQLGSFFRDIMIAKAVAKAKEQTAQQAATTASQQAAQQAAATQTQPAAQQPKEPVIEKFKLDFMQIFSEEITTSDDEVKTYLNVEFLIDFLGEEKIKEITEKLNKDVNYRKSFRFLIDEIKWWDNKEFKHIFPYCFNIEDILSDPEKIARRLFKLRQNIAKVPSEEPSRKQTLIESLKRSLGLQNLQPLQQSNIDNDKVIKELEKWAYVKDKELPIYLSELKETIRKRTHQNVDMFTHSVKNVCEKLSILRRAFIAKRDKDEESYNKAFNEFRTSSGGRLVDTPRLYFDKIVDMYEKATNSGKDEYIIWLAAVLHDIGKSILWPIHEKMSSELVKELLNKFGINDQKVIDEIKFLVENHAFLTSFKFGESTFERIKNNKNLIPKLALIHFIDLWTIGIEGELTVDRIPEFIDFSISYENYIKETFGREPSPVERIALLLAEKVANPTDYEINRAKEIKRKVENLPKSTQQKTFEEFLNNVRISYFKPLVKYLSDESLAVILWIFYNLYSLYSATNISHIHFAWSAETVELMEEVIKQLDKSLMAMVQLVKKTNDYSKKSDIPKKEKFLKEIEEIINNLNLSEEKEKIKELLKKIENVKQKKQEEKEVSEEIDEFVDELKNLFNLPLSEILQVLGLSVVRDGSILLVKMLTKPAAVSKPITYEKLEDDFAATHRLRVNNIIERIGGEDKKKKVAEAFHRYHIFRHSKDNNVKIKDGKIYLPVIFMEELPTKALKEVILNLLEKYENKEKVDSLDDLELSQETLGVINAIKLASQQTTNFDQQAQQALQDLGFNSWDGFKKVIQDKFLGGVDLVKIQNRDENEAGKLVNEAMKSMAIVIRNYLLKENNKQWNNFTKDDFKKLFGCVPVIVAQGESTRYDPNLLVHKVTANFVGTSNANLSISEHSKILEALGIRPVVVVGWPVLCEFGLLNEPKKNETARGVLDDGEGYMINEKGEKVASPINQEVKIKYFPKNAIIVRAQEGQDIGGHGGALLSAYDAYKKLGLLDSIATFQIVFGEASAIAQKDNPKSGIITMLRLWAGMAKGAKIAATSRAEVVIGKRGNFFFDTKGRLIALADFHKILLPSEEEIQWLVEDLEKRGMDTDNFKKLKELIRTGGDEKEIEKLYVEVAREAVEKEIYKTVADLPEKHQLTEKKIKGEEVKESFSKIKNLLTPSQLLLFGKAAKKYKEEKGYMEVNANKMVIHKDILANKEIVEETLETSRPDPDSGFKELLAWNFIFTTYIDWVDKPPKERGGYPIAYESIGNAEIKSVKSGKDQIKVDDEIEKTFKGLLPQNVEKSKIERLQVDFYDEPLEKETLNEVFGNKKSVLKGWVFFDVLSKIIESSIEGDSGVEKSYVENSYLKNCYVENSWVRGRKAENCVFVNTVIPEGAEIKDKEIVGFRKEEKERGELLLKGFRSSGVDFVVRNIINTIRYRDRLTQGLTGNGLYTHIAVALLCLNEKIQTQILSELSSKDNFIAEKVRDRIESIKQFVDVEKAIESKAAETPKEIEIVYISDKLTKVLEKFGKKTSENKKKRKISKQELEKIADAPDKGGVYYYKPSIFVLEDPKKPTNFANIFIQERGGKKNISPSTRLYGEIVLDQDSQIDFATALYNSEVLGTSYVMGASLQNTKLKNAIVVGPYFQKVQDEKIYNRYLSFPDRGRLSGLWFLENCIIENSYVEGDIGVKRFDGKRVLKNVKIYNAIVPAGREIKPNETITGIMPQEIELQKELEKLSESKALEFICKKLENREDPGRYTSVAVALLLLPQKKDVLLSKLPLEYKELLEQRIMVIEPVLKNYLELYSSSRKFPVVAEFGKKDELTKLTEFLGIDINNKSAEEIEKEIEKILLSRSPNYEIADEETRNKICVKGYHQGLQLQEQKPESNAKTYIEDRINKTLKDELKLWLERMVDEKKADEFLKKHLPYIKDFARIAFYRIPLTEYKKSKEKRKPFYTKLGNLDAFNVVRIITEKYLERYFKEGYKEDKFTDEEAQKIQQDLEQCGLHPWKKINGEANNAALALLNERNYDLSKLLILSLYGGMLDLNNPKLNKEWKSLGGGVEGLKKLIEKYIIKGVEKELKEVLGTKYEFKKWDLADWRWFKLNFIDGKPQKTIVFFPDNNLEGVFDLALIQEILKQNPNLTIYFVPKSKQVSNDFSFDDTIKVLEGSYFAPLRKNLADGKFVIIETGPAIQGVDFNYISKEVADALEKADLVITKGQANAECSWGLKKDRLHLFMSKGMAISPLSGISDKTVKGEDVKVCFVAYVPESMQLGEGKLGRKIQCAMEKKNEVNAAEIRFYNDNNNLIVRGLTIPEYRILRDIALEVKMRIKDNNDAGEIVADVIKLMTKEKNEKDEKKLKEIVEQLKQYENMVKLISKLPKEIKENPWGLIAIIKEILEKDKVVNILTNIEPHQETPQQKESLQFRFISFQGGSAGSLLSSVFNKLGLDSGLYVVSHVDDGGSTFKISQKLKPYYGILFPVGDVVNISQSLTTQDKKEHILGDAGRIREKGIKSAVNYANSSVVKTLKDDGLEISEDFKDFLSDFFDTLKLVDEKLVEKKILPLDGASLRNLYLLGKLLERQAIIEGANPDESAIKDTDKAQEAIDAIAKAINTGENRVSICSYEPATMFVEYEDDNIMFIKVDNKSETTLEYKGIYFQPVAIKVEGNVVKIRTDLSKMEYKEIRSGKEKKITENVSIENDNGQVIVKIKDKEYKVVNNYGNLTTTLVNIKDQNDKIEIARDNTGRRIERENQKGEKIEEELIDVDVDGVKFLFLSKYAIMQTHITEYVNMSKIAKVGFLNKKVGLEENKGFGEVQPITGENLFTDDKFKANQYVINQIESLKSGDIITIGPGSIITSLLPHLMSKGIIEALKEAKQRGVKVVWIMNPVVDNETINMSVKDIIKLVEKTTGSNIGEFVTTVIGLNGEIVDEEGKLTPDAKNVLMKKFGKGTKEYIEKLYERKPEDFEIRTDPSKASKAAKKSVGTLVFRKEDVDYLKGKGIEVILGGAELLGKLDVVDRATGKKEIRISYDDEELKKKIEIAQRNNLPTIWEPPKPSVPVQPTKVVQQPQQGIRQPSVGKEKPAEQQQISFKEAIEKINAMYGANLELNKTKTLQKISPDELLRRAAKLQEFGIPVTATTLRYNPDVLIQKAEEFKKYNIPITPTTLKYSVETLMQRAEQNGVVEIVNGRLRVKDGVKVTQLTKTAKLEPTRFIKSIDLIKKLILVPQQITNLAKGVVKRQTFVNKEAQQLSGKTVLIPTQNVEQVLNIARNYNELGMRGVVVSVGFEGELLNVERFKGVLNIGNFGEVEVEFGEYKGIEVINIIPKEATQKEGLLGRATLELALELLEGKLSKDTKGEYIPAIIHIVGKEGLTSIPNVIFDRYSEEFSYLFNKLMFVYSGVEGEEIISEVKNQNINPSYVKEANKIDFNKVLNLLGIKRAGLDEVGQIEKLESVIRDIYPQYEAKMRLALEEVRVLSSEVTKLMKTKLVLPVSLSLVSSDSNVVELYKQYVSRGVGIFVLSDVGRTSIDLRNLIREIRNTKLDGKIYVSLTEEDNISRGYLNEISQIADGIVVSYGVLNKFKNELINIKRTIGTDVVVDIKGEAVDERLIKECNFRVQQFKPNNITDITDRDRWYSLPQEAKVSDYKEEIISLISYGVDGIVLPKVTEINSLSAETKLAYDVIEDLVISVLNSTKKTMQSAFTEGYIEGKAISSKLTNKQKLEILGITEIKDIVSNFQQTAKDKAVDETKVKELLNRLGSRSPAQIGTALMNLINQAIKNIETSTQQDEKLLWYSRLYGVLEGLAGGILVEQYKGKYPKEVGVEFGLKNEVILGRLLLMIDRYVVRDAEGKIKDVEGVSGEDRLIILDALYKAYGKGSLTEERVKEVEENRDKIEASMRYKASSINKEDITPWGVREDNKADVGLLFMYVRALDLENRTKAITTEKALQDIRYHTSFVLDRLYNNFVLPQDIDLTTYDVGEIAKPQTIANTLVIFDLLMNYEATLKMRDRNPATISVESVKKLLGAV